MDADTNAAAASLSEMFIQKNSPMAVFIRNRSEIFQALEIGSKVADIDTTFKSRIAKQMLSAADFMFVKESPSMLRRMFHTQATSEEEADVDFKLMDSFVASKEAKENLMPITLQNLVEIRFAMEKCYALAHVEIEKAQKALGKKELSPGCMRPPLNELFGKIILKDEKLSDIVGPERAHIIKECGKHSRDKLTLDRLLRILQGQFFVEWRNEPPHWNEIYIHCTSPVLGLYYNSLTLNQEGVDPIRLVLTVDASVSQSHPINIPDYAKEMAAMASRNKKEEPPHNNVLTDDDDDIPVVYLAPNMPVTRVPETAVVHLDSMIQVATGFYRKALGIYITSGDDVF